MIVEQTGWPASAEAVSERHLKERSSTEFAGSARMSEPAPAGWLTTRISLRRNEAEGIVRLHFVSAQGNALPPFEAGSHIDVEIAPGLVRQYSLCGNPRENSSYQVAVLLEQESRGGSAGIHRDFQQGRQVRIGYPRNAFPLIRGASHSILIAGGIGVTPLLSMAHHLLEAGSSFELHYCVRDRSRAAFLHLLEDGELGRYSRLHFDDGPRAQLFDPVPALARPSKDVHVYICGPSGFIGWVRKAATVSDWPNEQLHVEYFTQAASEPTNGFEVIAQRTGAKVLVGLDQSIAAALRQAGIDVSLSCEAGVCGTCLVQVLDGIPEHRDTYQTDKEKLANNRVACCCSRALTPYLVLDV